MLPQRPMCLLVTSACCPKCSDDIQTHTRLPFTFDNLELVLGSEPHPRIKNKKGRMKSHLRRYFFLYRHPSPLGSNLSSDIQLPPYSTTSYKPNQAAQFTGLPASSTRNKRTMASGLRSASPYGHGSRTLIGNGTTIGGRSL